MVLNRIFCKRNNKNTHFHTIDAEQDGWIVFGPFEHVSMTFPYMYEEEELFPVNKVNRILAGILLINY
jgi:hypothetical protein